MSRSRRSLALLLGGLGLLALLLLVPRRDFGLKGSGRGAAHDAPGAAAQDSAPAGIEGAAARPAWPPKEAPPAPVRKPKGANPLDGMNRGIMALPGAPEGSYVMREQNASAFFTPEGVTFAMLGAATDGAGPADQRVHALRWSPVGAGELRPRPVDELPGKVNSFVGASAGWIQNGSTYKAVQYDQIAPGVDLRVESRLHAVKTTFEARRARDFEGLQFRYEGAGSVRVVDDGRALEVQTPAGLVREDGLVCWQDVDGARRPVDARYESSGGSTYAISVSGADPEAPLTVDPLVTWSSFLGGTQCGVGDDYGTSVAVDASGNVFVAGYTYCIDFPVLPVPGAFQTALNIQGQVDAFLVKLTSAGVLAWGTYYGGTSSDYGLGVAVDPASGDAFLTGYTTSADFPVSAGSADTTYNYYDVYVARFASAGGARIWATFFGGTNSEYGYAIAVNATGVYIGGYTYSGAGSNFPLTGAFDAVYGPNQDGFVAKLNLTGTSVLYSSYVGGSGYDYVQGVAVNSLGECFVTGYTDSTDFNQAAGLFNVIGGGQDAFLLKVNAAGGLAWSTYLGGLSTDWGTAVTVTADAAADPVVVGYTQSTNFPVTAGAYDTIYNGQEAFVVRVKSDGSGPLPVYSTFLGGTSTDYGQGVAAGGVDGSVYVTGRTSGSTFPFSLGAFRTTSFGGYDLFISQLNAAGTLLLASTYAGGNSTDYGLGIAVLPTGANAGVFVAGRTYSTDFGSTAASRPDSTLGGNSDACATKLNLTLTASPWATYVGGGISVADNQANDAAVDPAGNVYVVGQTNAFNFPTTAPGTVDPVPGFGGLLDVFVTKIGTDGSGVPFLVWSTYLGGSNYDYGTAIAVDSSSFALVTGYTGSSDFPLATPDDGILNSYDAFLTYIDSTGALYRSTFIGGSNSEYGRGVAVDAGWNVYVTGQTYSADFPFTAGAFDSTLATSPDGFVAKYSPSGVKLWASYFGGNNTDEPRSIASDAAGNVYVAGLTYSTDFVTGGAGPDPTFGGQFDAFVLKVSTAGALQWSRYLGGNSYDVAYAVGVDAAGTSVIAVGYTYSADFPLLNAMDSSLTSYEGFVTKLAPATGDTTWSTYLGGSSLDYVQAVELDSNANVYVVGYTYSTNFPTKNAFDPTHNGSTDAFVAKIYADGQSLAWSSFLGGASYDYGYGVARDAAGVVYVTGYTQSMDFPILNAVDTTMSSLNEGFIVRLDNAPPAAPDFAVAGAGQFRTGGTAIAVGAWTNENSITVKARINDSDDEPVRLEVEIKPLGTAFDSLGTTVESAPGGAAGTLHSLVVPLPLAAPAQFHWRARSLDAFGGKSGWVNFGGTADIFTPDVGTDDTGPVPLIGAPASGATFYTTAASIGLGGTVSDDASGAVLATWTNAGPPSSGTASLAVPNWSVPSTALAVGANLVTVTATDAAGNTGNAQITIYRDNSPPFPVTITSPAADPFITGVDAVDVYVNVTDNLLVGSVAWSNDRGGSGSGTLDSGTAVSGAWKLPTTGLSPGLNVITVTATDAAGNSATDSVTLNFDTLPPNLAVTGPVNGLVTAAASVTLSGTASDNGLLAGIQWNNTSTGGVGAVSAPLSPAWSVTPVALTAGSGPNVIQVTATDSVGLSTVQSITVYRDVTVPTVVTVTSPPTSPFVTGSSTISVQGTAADNIGVGSVQITNTANGQVVSASLGTPGGASTTFVGPALTLVPNVNNVIQIVARDLVTPTPNPSLTTSVTVFYDTTAPSLVVNAPPPSPFVTNIGSIFLSGTCSDNTTVTSFSCTNTVGAVVTPVAVNLAPAVPTAALDWDTTVALAAGTNTITLTAQDDVPLSTTVVITVIYDPSAPTVKVTGPTTADDFYTGTSTLALAGTASDNRGVTLVTWTTTAAVVPASGTATGTAAWSIGSINLEIGVQTVTVTSTDEAGNTATDTLVVTRDPTAPTLTINVPTVADTFTTNLAATPVSGTASDAVGVTLVTWNNAANGTSGSASGTTSWSVPSVSLVPGANPITVMAFDAAGNLISDTVNVYRDNANPTGAITSPATSPYVTNSGTLPLAGTAGDDIGVASVAWSNPGGPAPNSGAATGTTSWSASITLAPGDNTISVVVTDGFGNTSAGTPISVLVHYDPNLPSVTVTDPDATPDASTNTNSSPLALGGTVTDLDGAGVSAAVQVAWSNLTTGGTGSCLVAGGTWSASIPLTAGTNLIDVTATDAAGNTDSASFTAVYDTAIPSIAIVTPTSDLSYATANSPLLVAGTAGDDVGLAGVSWTTTGSVPTTFGTAAGTAAWSFPLDLAPGPNLVTVTATDVVGRVSTSRVTITYDPTAPTVAVTSPTYEPLFQSTLSPLSLAGQASDNLDVQLVTWINNTTGEQGLASGTTVWTIGAVTLVGGLNNITITATDGVGNTGSTTIDVDYDGLPPLIAVTPPVPPVVVAPGPPYVTSTRPFPVAGTASDDQTLQSVTWVNSRGGGGTATLGAGTWSAAVYLYPSPPDNVITFTATDAHGQTATASLTVTYNPESTAPSIDIQTPVVTDSATQVVAIGGVSSDNVGVVSVIWRNLTTGVQGPAVPAAPGDYSTWSANVPLTSGANVIRATGYDDVGNSAVDTITITFATPADAVPPGIDITGPTLASVWDENASPMLLTASATDVGGSGVASVSWSNAGTGGDGTGTPGLGTVWTANIALAFGTNVITVTARDAAGNAATDTLIVNFIPPPGDAANPTVSILPAPTGTVSVSAAPYALAGTATDNVAVATVVWSNAANGASGSAEGTSAWTLGLILEPGINVITVKAYDTSALVDTDSITVLYTPPPPPPEIVPAGSCGLLGLDALALLAALACWRRRV